MYTSIVSSSKHLICHCFNLNPVKEKWFALAASYKKPKQRRQLSTTSYASGGFDHLKVHAVVKEMERPAQEMPLELHEMQIEQSKAKQSKAKARASGEEQFLLLRAVYVKGIGCTIHRRNYHSFGLCLEKKNRDNRSKGGADPFSFLRRL